MGRSKDKLVDDEVGKKDIHTQYSGDSVRVRTNTVSYADSEFPCSE